MSHFDSDEELFGSGQEGSPFHGRPPENAVERVLKKCPLLVRTKLVGVEKFEPGLKTAQPGNDDIGCCIIRVTGLTPTTDKETLTLYFENRNKSGGGDIDNIEFLSDGSVLITFVDPQVTHRVLQQRDLNFNGSKLTTSRWQKPSPQDSKSTKEKLNISAEAPSMFFGNDLMSDRGDMKEDLVLKEWGNVTETVEERVAVRPVVSRMTFQPLETSLVDYRDQEPVGEMKTVYVSGLAMDTATEMVSLFFEDEKKSGGGDVEKVDVKLDGTAVITFQDVGVAQRVLEKEYLLLSGKRLAVSSRDTQMANDLQSCQQSPKSPAISSIQVSGLTDKISEDALFYYFQNKRRSNGGEIKHIKVDKAKLVAFITFRDAEVASRVLEKGDHHLVDVHLEVKEYRPPRPIPSDRCKVFLEGVKADTTDECLGLYIENRCDREPQTIITGSKKGTRMVIFDKPIDVSGLRKSFSEKPLEGSFLTISSVPVSNCIKVTSLSPTTTRECLMLYFENTKRSGGGETSNCFMFKDQDCCMIYFSDFRVINGVIKRKHSLDGHKLNVCVHYDCLGMVSVGGSEKPLVLPKPVVKSDINLYLLDFLLQTPRNQHDCETMIHQVYGEAKWPTKSGDSLKIHSLLTKDMRDIRKLILGWRDSVMVALQCFLDLFSVREVVCLAETWPDIKAALLDEKTRNPTDDDACILVIDDSEKKVVIAGQTNRVEDYHKMVQRMKTMVEDNVECQKNVVKEKKTLKKYQVLYLSVVSFPERMKIKHQHLDVNLHCDENEAEFTGVQRDIANAQLTMYEEINRLTPNKMSASQHITKLMQRSQTTRYLTLKLKQNNVCAAWGIEGSEVTVFAPTDNDIAAATHIIGSSLVEIEVPIDADSVPFLKSPIWRAKVQELEELHDGVLAILSAPDNSSFTIVATDDIITNIVDITKHILQINAIFTELKPLDSGMVKFIQNYKMDQINSLKKAIEHSRFNVEIQIAVTEEEPGIFVKGTREELYIVKEILDQITGKVKCRQYHISKSGIPSYLSARDHGILSTIEQSSSCTIREDSRQDSTDTTNLKLTNTKTPRQQSTQSSEVSECHHWTEGNLSKPADVQICLVKGDIAKQKADVLVNSTGKDLMLGNGSVSKSLLLVAGQQMQEEIKLNYPNGLASHGELAITDGYNLECNKVFHGSLPDWDKGQAREVLVQFIQACLTNAHDGEFSSIFFPAIGAGKLKFPKRVVAETMYDTVTKFSLDNPETSIKTVNFIVFPGDIPTVQAFETEHGMWTGSALSGPSIRREKRKSGVFTGTSKSQGGCSPIVIKQVYEDQMFKLGSVSLQVTQCDTKESADAIVHITSRHLDSSTGTIVYDTILKEAGEGILTEIIKKSDAMQREGLVVTSSGNLNCRFIIHLDVSTSDTWKKKMTKCLSKANEMQLTSLTYPALITDKGTKTSAGKIADDTFSAIMEFQKKLSGTPHLTDIRLVVFQKDMFVDIVKEVALRCEKQERKPLLGKMYGAVSGLFGSSRESGTSGDQAKSNKKSISLVIYSDNDSSIDNAIDNLNEICKSRSDDKVVTDPWTETIKSLSDQQVADIYAFGNEYGVKMSVEKEDAFVRIQGLHTDVLAVDEKLTKVLIKIQGERQPKGSLGNALVIPPTWKEMNAVVNLEVVRLQPTDQEYQSVLENLLTQMPAANVIKVKRIQNRSLYVQYLAQKMKIERGAALGTTVEKTLWHGTRADTVPSINSYGFNRSYCGKNATSYGNGVYFAVNATMSANDIFSSPDAKGRKHMYQAKVLVGAFTQGNDGLVAPPVKKGHILYDSVVDDRRKPRMFIVFHDSQAYPEYLITFKC